MNAVRRPSVVDMPVVAMVGGGQLARMTHQAAVALGQSLRVLAVDRGDPAAQVTRTSSSASTRTSMRFAARCRRRDGADLRPRKHVPTELLETLVTAGVNVAPPPQALVHAQDKNC